MSIDITLSVWTTWGGETGIRWRSSGFGDSVAASDCVRHGAVAGEAGADGVALPVDVALRIPPTRARYARVWPGHALEVAAHHVRPAVWVPFAFSTTTSDGVRLRDEAWLAGADGVTSMVHITHSSGAAGVRLGGDISTSQSIFEFGNEEL